MTKDELTRIVDLVYVAWQMDLAEGRKVYEVWYRYLGDLEFDEVRSVIDAAVTAGDRWAPRVGELRRRCIDAADPTGGVPAGEIAWQFAEDRLRAVNSGVQPAGHANPVVDSMIGAAMRAAGTGDGFHKQAFLAAWDQQIASYEQDRYGL